MPYHKFSFGLMLSLIALIGCGGSTSAPPPPSPPPVTGPFTNASFNGTYVFSIRGTNVAFFAVAGSIQADGNGHITAGTEDIASPGTGTVATQVPITGTYSVLADGRTTATLNSASGNFTLDFVLLSNQHGLAIRFNTNATAVGSIDVQDPSALTASALQGTYSFSVFGIDSSGGFEAKAGDFTIPCCTVGLPNAEDINDNGTLTFDSTISASLEAPVGGTGGLTIGSDLFTYYIVDATHLVIIQNGSQSALAGDVYLTLGPLGTTPSSTSILSVAGTQSGQPFVAGAILNTDSNGNLLSSSVEDLNVGGTTTPSLAITGTLMDFVTPGFRGLMALTNTSGTSNYAFYPSVAGFLTISLSSTTVATGLILDQQAGPFMDSSVNGTYGLNMSGKNVNGGVNALAQFTADAMGHLKGNLDLNSSGAVAAGQPLTGTYTVGLNGRGTASLQIPSGTLNLILYIADGTHILFIESDSQVSAGTIEQQQ